jgi:large subunit ribosomal protein L23
MDVRDVILAPIITEKSMTAAAENQYTFEVHPDATKTQIRDAAKVLFKVDVLSVNTRNVKGKNKTVARRKQRTAGKRSDWKKAIITIKAGQKIATGGFTYFEQ